MITWFLIGLTLPLVFASAAAHEEGVALGYLIARDLKRHVPGERPGSICWPAVLLALFLFACVWPVWFLPGEWFEEQ